MIGENYAYSFGGKEFDTRGGLFHYDFGARHYDPALCQFTTADPLAEKYYPYSPYLYCAGNPILFVDPTGLGRFYLFDVVGSYMGYIDCDDIDNDVICIVEYRNGQKVIKQDNSGRFLQVFVGAGTFEILRIGGGGGSGDVYSVRGDNDAINVFEFFANTITKNYEVEYALFLTSSSVYCTSIGDTNSRNYIVTSHDIRKVVFDGYFFSLIDDKFVKIFINSHPNSWKSSRSDMSFVKNLQNFQYNIGGLVVSSYIYHVPTQTYVPYTFILIISIVMLKNSFLFLLIMSSFVSDAQLLYNGKTNRQFTADVLVTTDTAFCERLFALIDSTIDVNKDPYVNVSICSITNERLHDFDGNWRDFFIVVTTSNCESHQGLFTFKGINFIMPTTIPIMKKTGKTVTMHEYGLKFFDSDNMTVIECNRGQLEYITKDYIDIYRSFYE